SLMETILCHSDLYAVLGVDHSVNQNDLRRAYMSLCRRCHPDKFPNEPMATTAFQRISYAYDILSNPRTRKLYDAKEISDTRRAQDMHNADDTLNHVLQAIWADFLDGDFEIIRMLLRSINETNPSLNLGGDATETLLSALFNIREVIISGQQHFRLIKFELMRLYEIQYSLRQLSYFDVPGRLKLTMQLARLTIALPINVDKAI
ncbi:DnaJ-domain-containing protein, partial [Ceratobasidium sp. AG-I]